MLNAYTEISINLPVEDNTNYFEYEISDTNAEFEKYLSIQTNISNLAYEYYKCYKKYKQNLKLNAIETVTISDFKCSLSKYPSYIEKIEVIKNFSEQANFNSFVVNGKDLVFKYIDYAIINVYYKYNVEKHLIDADLTLEGIKDSEIKGAIFVSNDNYKELIDMSFSLTEPVLSGEVIDNYVLAKTALVYNKANISCLISGGNLSGIEPTFIELIETVEFIDGIGKVDYNVAQVLSYKFIDGSRGIVYKKDGGYYGNYLRLDTGNNGIYEIKYVTQAVKFYFTLIDDSGTFVLTDVLDNKATGDLTGTKTQEYKDIEIKVVDYLTGAPLLGARVEVAGIVATTDKDGIAYLKNVPVGLQKVTIYKDGYLSNLSDNLANEYINV